MKNHSAYRRLRETKGFTLMEILVVMVIIVVLATLTISIYTWLETRKNEQGNAFHVSAQIILQKPCGCQKIVPPCTKPSSTGRGGRLPEKKPCTEKYR